MNKFSIKDIETLTGVKAHTLRVWEQRYKLVEPKRTETNIRFYDDDDLKLLLNVSLLNNRGHKISELSRMDHEVMNSMVRDQTLVHSDNFDEHLQTLTLHMLTLNERGFERSLGRSIAQVGLERAMVQVIFPFLYNVGVLWQTGSITPAHEHFITNLIRQKLIVAIDGQTPLERPDEKKFLLFLPEGELHEVGLLFTNYVIQARGHRVMYLGQNVPIADVQPLFEGFAPHHVITAVVSPLHAGATPFEFLEELSAHFPTAHVFVSGMQVTGYEGERPANVSILKDLREMLAVIGD